MWFLLIASLELAQRFLAVIASVFFVSFKIGLQVNNSLVASAQHLLLNEIVKGSDGVVLVVLETILDLLPACHAVFSHFVNYLVVNGHRMVADDYAHDLWLDVPDLLEKR